MANPTWSLAGDYFENCDCEILCPCLLSRSQARPTEGDCSGMLAFHVERGRCGEVDLAGLNTAVMFSSDGPMANGNWKVGLYLDARADAEQANALGRIFSGELGGPPAAIAAVTGTALGVKSVPIEYRIDGNGRSLEIPDVTQMNVEGIEGLPGQQVWFENVAHPVASRISAARGAGTWIRDHGFSWEMSGRNGHFAPFEWQG